MNVNDIVLTGGGLIITFDNGDVATGVFRYINGALSLSGLTNAQLNALKNTSLDESIFSDPRITNQSLINLGLLTIQNSIDLAQNSLDQITPETDKIDNIAVDGLNGVHNSLAYKIHEIERHLHSYERWLGKLAVPAGGKVTEQNETPFTIDGGNATWGSWVQILDSNDTPVVSGNEYWDLHEIFVTDVERTTAYRIQIAFGDDADTAITNNAYAEILFRTSATSNDRTPLTIQCRRLAAGTKAWARCRTSDNTALFSFLIGLHEYEG